MEGEPCSINFEKLIKNVTFFAGCRFMLSCIGFPECRAVQYFPGFVTDAEPHESTCSRVS